ncbi:response regulator [Geobacter grbiciae]|uniref:response regulator n=1 Tax=Geobacter grbiciae TaxID=155042 RepID=UPI001C03A307|nr:response regulator [Geobacter grbiciae]MBT1074265.1 response regulator [Geobacter grbiciae]
MAHLKVLVIDDDPSFSAVVIAFLSKGNFEAKGVLSGSEAFKEAESARYDLVLLDLKLPDADGMGILERIKVCTPSVPVIILTAGGDVESYLKAVGLGAFDYLQKPVERSLLLSMVERALHEAQ